MQLSVEQLETLDRGQPVLVDMNGRECVLLRRDTFEGQQNGLVADWHPSTMQHQMAEMMADDWNDPAMSVYDDD